MIERSLAFGPSAALIGTICEPGADELFDKSLAVVLFNAGVVHRIGPHRFNVRLARKLATHGIASIRFDLAGLGDSQRSKKNISYEAQAIEDLQHAMDALSAATQISRFALLGFCSGAHHAYSAALADERVVGLLLYDGYKYPTSTSRRNHFLLRFKKHRSPFKLIGMVGKRIWEKIAHRSSTSQEDVRVADVSYFSTTPAMSTFANGLDMLHKRGVNVVQVFSGGNVEQYNYREQFADGFKQFPIVADLSVEYFPDMDHVATGMASQQALINCAIRWATAGDQPITLNAGVSVEKGAGT
jgi:pimeloyl-ACP methyl ester carboxylesterase